MRAVVGIGNPGKSYSLTRHNTGFIFLDYFADKYSLNFQPSKNDYYYAKGYINDIPFLLIKPTTYVNLSGVAVNQVIEDYEIQLEDLLVVVDEINLDLGEIKVRVGGGDGGHNGMNSIIYNLNSNQFPRIKIGIGNNFAKGEQVDYVLSKFNDEELKILLKSFEFCKELLEVFIKNGTKEMLDFNSKNKDLEE